MELDQRIKRSQDAVRVYPDWARKGMRFQGGGVTREEKGVKNGCCNRTACQLPRATWYNSSTMKWYCPGCAHKINEHNPGLCTRGDHDEEH